MTKLNKKQKKLQIKHRNTSGQLRGGGPPTLNDLRNQLVVGPTGYENPVAHPHNSLLMKYEKRFAGSSDIRPDGKVVRWDSRTNKEYDPAEALKYINYWKHGTETPIEDINYLQAKENMERTAKEGPHPLRIWGSKRNRKGGKIVEAQHREYWSNEGRGGQQVKQLQIGTSFETDRLGN